MGGLHACMDLAWWAYSGRGSHSFSWYDMVGGNINGGVGGNNSNDDDDGGLVVGGCKECD